jgi:hypothetical protein
VARNPSAYGRPYRRRKARAFYPGVLCSLCGRPILTREDFVLHHDPPVSDGGTAFDEKPAHVACNEQHGRSLGGRNSRAARARRGEDEELELEQPAPRSRRHGDGSRGPRIYWPGAIDIEIAGPAEIVKPNGVVVRVAAGEWYDPDA